MTTVTNSSVFADFVAMIIGYINMLIPVLVTFALVLFLYAGVRYIYKSDSKSKGPERDAMLWGVVALFVIVSVWGILRLMCNTFIGTSDCRTASSLGSKALAIHRDVL